MYRFFYVCIIMKDDPFQQQTQFSKQAEHHCFGFIHRRYLSSFFRLASSLVQTPNSVEGWIPEAFCNFSSKQAPSSLPSPLGKVQCYPKHKVRLVELCLRDIKMASANCRCAHINSAPTFLYWRRKKRRQLKLTFATFWFSISKRQCRKF